MRNTRIQKSPLLVEGSSIVHRRVCFARDTVCERGNFTTKPEVTR